MLRMNETNVVITVSRLRAPMLVVCIKGLGLSV